MKDLDRMDSFCDAPRCLPQTITRDTLATVPVVPEISILCSTSNQPSNEKTITTPYQEWKTHQQQNSFPMYVNKENFHASANQANTQINSSILKKQVRFDGPSLVTNKPQGFNYKPMLNHIERNKTNVLAPHSPNVDSTDVKSNIPPKFKQIYLTNLPNRKLDLSVIEIEKEYSAKNNGKGEKLPSNPSEKTNPAESMPKSKDFPSKSKLQDNVVLNDSVTDIFNYKKNPIARNCVNVPEFNPNTQFDQKRTVQEIRENLFGKQKVSKEIVSNQTNCLSKLPENQNSDQDGNKNEYYKEISPIFTQPQYRKIATTENMQNINFNPNALQTTDYFGNTNNNRNFNEQKIISSPFQEAKQCSCKCNTKCSETDDVSVKDLLKIISQQSQQIAQQNEQLLLLQKQVSSLITQQKYPDCSSPKKPIEFRHCNYSERENCCNGSCEKDICKNSKPEGYKRYFTSDQQVQKMYNTPRKSRGKISNFSIGVMTSFEVSFTSQPPVPHSKKIYQCLPNTESNQKLEPLKIQEIKEHSSKNSANDQQENFIDIHDSQNSKTLGDLSMVFKEPIHFREPTPSPEPSIKFNTNEFGDFESDDDDDPPRPEEALYRNVMDQVNQILRNAQIPTPKEFNGNFDENCTKKLKNKTMREVKEATLKHLKNIGIDVSNVDGNSSKSNSSDDMINESYTQDDISFTVKQLLTKYLPSDYLEKIPDKNELICDISSPHPELLTPKNKQGAIKNRPEFSFASVQYMKKYNLMASAPKECNPLNRPAKTGKILDISKLKQQPKLL